MLSVGVCVRWWALHAHAVCARSTVPESCGRGELVDVAEGLRSGMAIHTYTYVHNRYAQTGMHRPTGLAYICMRISGPLNDDPAGDRAIHVCVLQA